MHLSRLWLALPRFLWRGKWFWGAWLLVFLLPQTRDEARLHFVGSRFVPRMYGQPWQEYWAGDKGKRGAPNMTPIERAVWGEQRQNSYNYFDSYSYGSNTNPAQSVAGRLLQRFPRESWLRALALRSSLGYGGSSLGSTGKSVSPLITWARKGQQLEPRNAFYPLILAKAMGDSGKSDEREKLLQRAAACSFFDDGSTALRRVTLGAARKAGVSTWTEQNDLYTRVSNGYYGNMTMDGLADQLAVMSQKDRAKRRIAALLARSRAMMRVALLLQSPPCESAQWRMGENWARSAWSIALTSPTPRARRWGVGVPSKGRFADYEPVARRHNDLSGVALARKCKARISLIAKATGPETQLFNGNGSGSGLVFTRSPSGFFWGVAAHACGFGVLCFGLYLLGWWWLASIFNWRATGQQSSVSSRALGGTILVALSVVGFFALFGWFYHFANVPIARRVVPPTGQIEVLAAVSGLLFFAPPLWLALWCAAKTRWQNRASLRLPARQQIEMSLSSLEGWLLGNATGAFLATFLTIGWLFAGVWAYLRWQGLVGYDWLRAVAPGVSTRLVPTELTSLESPVLPIYAALCWFLLTLVWLASWRFVVASDRRPVFHSGIRSWKEALGCALTATAWVYFALMLGCHVTGQALQSRLQVTATRGEGALVPGFEPTNQPIK